MQSGGWDGYYDSSSDSGDSMQGMDPDAHSFLAGLCSSGSDAISGMGDLNCGTTSATCPYVPDLGPVGTGSNYFPRSVDNDAAALNFLGYGAGFPGGGVSQAHDMANAEGAWDDTFQEAVKHFQGINGGLTVDGWIGPATRAALGKAVALANSLPRSPNALPTPKPPPAPGLAPPVPSPPSAPGVASADHTKRNLIIGGGVVAALVAGYFLFS